METDSETGVEVKKEKMYIRNFLLLLLVISAVGSSFFLGRFSETQKYSKEASNSSKTNVVFNEKTSAKLEEEIKAILENRGTLEKEEEAAFNKDLLPIYSSDFENKSVKVTTYSYRRKKIVSKSIDISEAENITIWEYQNPNAPKSGEFVIFSGYENYALYATTIEDLQSQWTESYKTKNNLVMHFDYGELSRGLEQSSIAAVLLESYQKTIPNYRLPAPILIMITVNVNKEATSKSDTTVLEAKKVAQKIADKIEFTQPQ